MRLNEFIEVLYIPDYENLDETYDFFRSVGVNN